MEEHRHFKVWDAKKKRWLKWFDIEALLYFDGEDEEGGESAFFIGTAYPDLIIVWGSGLRDKNGKEIYEGDIVTAFGKKEFPEEVKFGEIKDYEYDSFAGMGFYFDFSWVVQKEDIEVIGNIHENPELLKGGA